MFFKRVAIATVVGFLTGLLCAWGSVRVGYSAVGVLLSVVATRTVAGFAIGISRWRMPWWLHGPLMGAVFGLPLSLSALEGGGFYLLLGASAAYGFIIELITSVVFKARQS